MTGLYAGAFLVEGAILLAAARNSPSSQVLKDAAAAYKVNTYAIASNVKREFAAKEKTRAEAKKQAKPVAKAESRAKKAA
jgi:ParB family chromosome partitioning protein